MPNRRTIVLGIAAMPIALGATRAFAQDALAGEAIATSEGDVTIHPVGHASLALGFGAHVLYIDPAKEDFSGLPAPTGILVTHAHGDHFDIPSLEAMGGSAPILTTEEVAGKMAEGALSSSTADVAVSTTGIAGPTGAVPGKPVGTVCFGWSRGDTTYTERLVFQGDRQAVREQTVAHALQGLLRFIE